MLRWAAVLLVAGCYAPSARPGSPCETDTQCPSELRCIDQICERPGTPTSDAAPADADLPIDALVQGWSAPAALLGVNTDTVEDDPCLTANGLTLAFVSTRDGSPDIFLGTRDQLGQAFRVIPLTALNTGGDESSPEISADGTTIYFTSDRDSTGSGDVFRSHLVDRGWTAPEKVVALSTAKNESDLAISPDGLTIVLARNNQLLLGTRATTTAEFGPLADVPVLDIAGSPAAPSITNRAGAVYFHAGAVRDLYVAHRTGETFTSPQPIGELNSAGREDGPYISADERHLVFARDNDLYEVTR